MLILLGFFVLSGCVQNDSMSQEIGPKIIYDSFNDQDCQHTNRTMFTLSKETNVTDIYLWYHWSINETEVPFTILKDNTSIINHVLIRDNCEPFGSTWCNATVFLNQTFPAGTFELKVQNRQLGMNSESSLLGFIRIFGVQDS